MAGYNTIIATITGLGSQPHGMVVTPNGLWGYINNFSSGTVSVIDLTANSVHSTISGFSNPAGIVIDPTGTYAYVANYSAGTISIVTIASNTITGTITGLPVGTVTSGAGEQLVMNAAGTRIYAGIFGFSYLTVVNVTTGSVLTTIPGFGTTGSAGVIHPSGGYLYTLSPSAGEIILTNLTTLATSVAVSGLSTSISGIAISPDGNTLYVSVEQTSGEMYVISTATNTVTATVTGLGTNPQNIAVKPDNTFVYVGDIGASFNGTTVYPIAVGTNVVGSAISGFDCADNLTFNSAGTLLYVTNYGAGTISVVQTSNIPTITGVTLSGIGIVGNTITATPTGVTGTPTPTAAFAWIRNGNFIIGGATSNTYTLVAADDGTEITCIVSETNPSGEATATSAPMSIGASSHPLSANVTITATPTAMKANGIDVSNLLVTSINAAGNPVTTGGDTVTLSATEGTISAIVDNKNGSYTATYTAGTTPGVVTISGTMNGDAIGNDATITLGAGLATSLSITTAPSSTAVNKIPLTTQPVIKVKDEVGNTVLSAAGVISASVNNVQIATATLTSGVATFSGLFLTGIVGSTDQIVFSLHDSLSATSGVITLVAGSAGAVSASHCTITASPGTIPNDGVSKSAITIQACDASNIAETSGGLTFVLTATEGTLSTVTDNNDGSYTAYLTSSITAGTSVVSGTLGGAALANTASVVFQAGTLLTGITPTTMPPALQGMTVSTPVLIPGYTSSAAPAHLSADGVANSGNTLSLGAGTVTFTTTDTAGYYTYTLTFAASATYTGNYAFFLVVSGFGPTLIQGTVRSTNLVVSLQDVNPSTGTITTICELSTASDIEVELAVGGSGSIKATVLISELCSIANSLSSTEWALIGPPSNGPLALVDPWALELNFTVGGVSVGCGPIQSFEMDFDSGTVELTGAGLLSYFDHRAIEAPGNIVDSQYALAPLSDPQAWVAMEAPDANSLQFVYCWMGKPPTGTTGQYNIYERLIALEQEKPYGKLGIPALTYGSGANLPGSAQLPVASFACTDTVSSAFQNIADSGPGFEFFIQPSNRTPIVVSMQGNDNRQSVVMSNRNSTVIKLSGDGDDLTTSAYSEGTGYMGIGSLRTVNASYPPQSFPGTWPESGTPSGTATARLEQYGRHIYPVDGTEMTTTTALRALCQAYEMSTNRSLLQLTLSYDCAPGRPIGLFDTGPGDLISVELLSFFKGVSAAMSANLILPFRIMSWTLVAPAAGSSTYSVQMELEMILLNPTTGLPLQRQARSLHGSKMLAKLYRSVFK